MEKNREENGDSTIQPSRDSNRSSGSSRRMENLRIAVASIIVFIWSIMYIRTFFDPKFNTPPELSIPMMAVAGWLYGSAAFKEIGRKNGD